MESEDGVTFGQWLDDCLPKDPRTCSLCLGATGFWDEYTEPVDCDLRDLDLGLVKGYTFWMPCPYCSELGQLDLAFAVEENARPFVLDSFYRGVIANLACRGVGSSIVTKPCIGSTS